MRSREIEEFAEALVREVRDRAISASDALLEPQAKSPPSARWRTAKVKADAAQLVIADAVDHALFYLLHAIDNGHIRLKFISESGKEIDLTEEGLAELAGSYGSSGGWCAKYSKERFIDDFADLASKPH